MGKGGQIKPKGGQTVGKASESLESLAGLDSQVKILNSRLAERGLSFVVQRISQSLFARGTFLLSDGTKERRRVSLGLKAIVLEKDFASAEARTIQLHTKIKQLGYLPENKEWWKTEFEPSKRNQKVSVIEGIEELKRQFWEGRKETPQARRTWSRMQPLFDALPQKAELNIDLLMSYIVRTPEDSNARQKICQYFKRLGKVNHLQQLERIDPLFGKYEPQKFEPPDEEHLEELVESLRSDKKWGWCFAALFVYGCRPSEVFSLQVNKNGTGKVLTIKQKRKLPTWRTCLALPQHLVESLNLYEIDRPWDVYLPEQYDSEKAQELINGWGKWLRRRRGHMDLSLYSLRHSWAVRSIKSNLETGLASKCMGHDVSTHMKTYSRYLTEKDIAEVAAKLL